FELVTAYSPELYGYLASVTRALERAIYYWVDAAEIAARLHSGIRPAHTLF
ncbi:MAG: phosphate transport system protein, partial [Salinirussus sp.]